MKKGTGLALVGLAGIGVYGLRRSILARVFKLRPPEWGVEVERDIPVVMPDGVRLFTDHYYPKTKDEVGDGFPTILIRTPYGRGREAGLANGYPLAELPAQRFAERGYHVVVQGVRGCFDSEGTFTAHAQEAADGQVTVVWISQQPWFNGVLGTWGPSYLGYTQWAAAAGAPPSLQAMVVMIASSENFTVSYPDGTFGLETRLRWSQGMYLQKLIQSRPLREKLVKRFSAEAERRLQEAYGHLPLLEADTVLAGGPIPIYRAVLSHDDSEGDFWRSRDHSGAVARVTAPVHLVGGWYDYYLRGLLRDFATLRAAGREPYLTIGPWYHAQPAGMVTGLREGLDWFDARLKGEGSLRRKPVRLYVMGADEWRELDEFPPPARETRYYLRAEGGLSTEPPVGESPSDRYGYDPADPTPAVGGALLASRGAGPQDNGPLEARADVLCYTTPSLERDLEVIGPVWLELYARSSLVYTDFFGRLCDVAPNGRSTNICDGLVRVEPGRGEVEPDGTLRVVVELWATAHRFCQGHRLRLQVSSGAHPRWSRNLGTGEPLATGMRMEVAEQAVYHDAAHPSAVVLPVVAG